MPNQLNRARLGIELEFMMANHLNFGDEQANNKSLEKYRDGRFPDNTPKPLHVIFGSGFNSQCMLQACEAIAGCGLPATVSVTNYGDLSDDPLTQGAAESDLEDVPCDPDDKRAGMLQYRVWNRHEAVEIGESKFHFGFWHVTSELTITNTQYENPAKGTPKGPYDWYAIEISSPIVSNAADLSKDLTKIFASLQNKTKVWLNNSCGMHIHASPASGELTETIAKKVVALVFLLEQPLINKIIHPARKTSPYCVPITEGSRIAVDPSRYGNKTNSENTYSDMVDAINKFHNSIEVKSASQTRIYQRLLCIFNQVDMDKLGSGLKRHSDNGKSALDLSTYNTIEFRYIQASFDSEYISFWTDLIQTLFSIATKSNREYCERLTKLYKLSTKVNPEYDWPHYLEFLGLSHRTKRLEAYVAQYRTSLKNLDRQPVLPKVGNSGESSTSSARRS